MRAPEGCQMLLLHKLEASLSAEYLSFAQGLIVTSGILYASGIADSALYRTICALSSVFY